MTREHVILALSIPASMASSSAVQVQLAELLRRGFIEPSKSTCEAPVFFVKKADGSLRMVCDWRGLNRITIKNQACLLNIDDFLDAVQVSTYSQWSIYGQVATRFEL